MDENKRYDGFENELSLQGRRGKSKSGSTVFLENGLLTQALLRDVYISGGVGATICTRPAYDMTRKGFEIVSEADTKKIDQKLKRLKLTKSLYEALVWSRTFGGGIIFMRVDDGQEQDQPLNMNNIKSVEALSVYEAGVSNVVSVTKRYDQTSSKVGEPEIYSISPSRSTSFSVHESRIVRFDGKTADQLTKGFLKDWGISELQAVYDDFLMLGGDRTSASQILSEYVIGVLKMVNLFGLLQSPKGRERLENRLDLFDQTKSNENTAVVDTEEDFQKHNSTMSGVEKILEIDMMSVSGTAGIPATLLFGRSPAGENATGESDITLYYDSIASKQVIGLEPGVSRVVEVVGASKEVGFSGEFEIEFNPLWQQTEEQKATTFKTAMEAASIAIANGIYTAEEIRETFNFAVKLSDTVPDVTTPPAKEEENENDPTIN